MIATTKLLTTTFVTMKATAPKSKESCFLFSKKYVAMPLISPAIAAELANENWKARLCCSKKASISSPWLRKKPRIAAPTATKTKLPVKNEPASLTRNSRLLRRSTHLSELSTIELRLDCISCHRLESFSVLFISQDHAIFYHARKNYRDCYLRETCRQYVSAMSEFFVVIFIFEPLLNDNCSIPNNS